MGIMWASWLRIFFIFAIFPGSGADNGASSINPDAGEGGVTRIQVNEHGEVAAVDESILSPEIAIQITDNVTPENVVENEMIEAADPNNAASADATNKVSPNNLKKVSVLCLFYFIFSIQL